MPNHSILQKEVISNNLPRNSFDLSYRRLFTADVGELLPIYCEHVNPNEKFSIKPTSFLRAQTLNTAAFTRIKQNIDFFFVPYRLLSSYLPQILVGTDYNVSSNFPITPSTRIPYFHGGPFEDKESYSVSCFDVVGDLNPLCVRSNPGQPKSSLNMFKFNRTSLAARLMELLGYGRLRSDMHTSNDIKDSFGLSALNIFAYNRIYNDMYRNPLLEKYNVICSNFDYLYTNAQRSNAFSEFVIDDTNLLSTSKYAEAGLFDMKYHSYKMDYFTHQFTDFRAADFLNVAQSSPIFGDNKLFPAYASSSPNVHQGVLAISDNDFPVGLTVSNLRSAYALDKLLATTQNAKDGSYNEQIKAHFGFDPSLDNQKVKFIGSVDAAVTISDVEGTATTDSSTLGQITGKGVSLSNGSFEFTTNEHGIIMGIFYLLPEADYSSFTTTDPMLLKITSDRFFKPEFQDLGLQPCTQVELLGPTGLNLSSNPASALFGYTNRYSEYKSRVDLISSEFNTDLGAWVTPRRLDTMADQTRGLSLNLAFSKVNPSSMNNIFAIAADGEHNQFMCAAQFNATAIRPMSIFGSPYSNI